MKKKIWVVSPVFYLLVVALVLMTAVSYRYDRMYFFICLAISLLAFCGLFISDVLLRRRIASAMRDAKRVMSAQDENTLDDFSIAVAVVAEQGDVVWGNARFRREMAQGKSFAGDSVLKYIYPHTLRQVMNSEGLSTTCGGRAYTMHATKSQYSYLLYFVEDTEYKQIAKEYKEKHPVVCVAVFDNREEIARGGMGGEESRINTEVDMAMRDWGNNEMGGFTRKLDNNRYLIVTDEAHIEAAKKKRFEVIDRVRTIKSDNRTSATVSIGVGRGAGTIAESERWARQALDMALGRGGDQVAVKLPNDTFEFFGGLSKGVEKRDKVRTRVIAAAISDRVRNSDRVFIMGHKNSDLDSVGAAIGMWAVISKGLKKPAYVVVNREQSLAKHLVEHVAAAYAGTRVFLSPREGMDAITKDSTLIITDTHSVNFVESEELLAAAKSVIVIDHHRMMVSHIKDAQIFYHEPYASSASEMVAELVQYIRGNVIEAADAQAMLAGIMLDTKNFVLKTGARTFEASAFLKRCGADTVEVKRYFSDTLETYKEKAQLVSGSEIYKGCAIAVSNWSHGDMRIAAAQAADELLSIQDVMASFVIYRNGSNINISARSLGDVNVQLIVEDFGGGGHLTMAGAQLNTDSLSEVRKRLIEILDEKLEQVTVRE